MSACVFSTLPRRDTPEIVPVVACGDWKWLQGTGLDGEITFWLCALWYGFNCSVLSHARLFVTPWTVAHQAPPSMGFPRQEYWSGLPFLFFLSQGSNPHLLSLVTNCISYLSLYLWIAEKKKKKKKPGRFGYPTGCFSHLQFNFSIFGRAGPSLLSAGFL